MSALEGVLLVAATVTTGLMAGVFGLYAHTIMPGLRGADDRTFVGAFQALDEAIINPLFLVTFLGPLPLIALAGVVELVGAERPALLWIATALVLYLAVFIITVRVHVPLNDALKAAGEPGRIADLAAARARLDEARWVAWNVVRTVLCTAAFGCLAWALVEYGRAV